MQFLSITINALVVGSGAAASLRGEQRDLAVLYYPRYTGDYQTGWCTSNNKYAQGSPGYSTELACCNAQFGSQTSGKCYSMLPSPPTASPVGVNGPDAFYADRTKDYADGVCINTVPAPIGAVFFDTELECCKAEYGVQTSGACLAALPSPPTASPLTAAGPDIWYKNPAVGDWTVGYCINDHPAPSGLTTYDSELDCCKGAYAGQSSGKCLSMLPSPPTASPFGVNGPDAFYADRTKDYADGVCINTVPAPIGATIYDTELECCKGEYGVQTTGACLAALPSPPTASPLTAAGPDIWYKNPEVGDWAVGYCINDHPAPDGATTYDSELDCCKGAYAGQSSGTCLSKLPSPPTASPFGVNGPDAFYKAPNVDWNDGHCINTVPAPVGAKIYDTELECCKGEYGTQSSGACLAALPSPPTASPITAAGPDAWYKKPDMDWATGYCVNDHPAPSDGSVTIYETELDCCKGSYAGQSSGACLSNLPSPPTASPVGVNSNFYKAPNVDWNAGHCINTAPVPVGATVYDTELDCCKAEYATQSSGACLAALPSPPTASPAGSDSPFYPLWPSWDAGHCDNDPTERPSGNNYEYATQAECCEAWFPNQSSNACMNHDPTYGSRSPTQAPVL